MGVHSRYDDTDKLSLGQRTGQPGRHRASRARNPYRAYALAAPGCDATTWDMPPVYRARHRPCAAHPHPRLRLAVPAWLKGLSAPVRARFVAGALLLALAFAGVLGALSGSGSGAHAAQRQPRKIAMSLNQVPALQLAKTMASARAMAMQSAALRARTVIHHTTVTQPPAQQPPAFGIGPGAGSLYTIPQIEALWQAEGGPASTAPVAACIAVAESNSGTGTAKPWAFNGRDIGMWQIDPGNYSGPSSDLYQPAVNAQVAVRMSNGGRDWSAWTTAGSCGV